MLWGQINIYFKQNIVMLLITESKKDSTFPVNQSYLDGYNAPYRHDLPLMAGGILVYVHDNV